MSHPEKTSPSPPATALSLITVALAITALALCIVYLLAQLVDLLGSQVELIKDEDNGASCYVYRSSISCLPSRPAPARSPKPSKHPLYVLPMQEAQG